MNSSPKERRKQTREFTEEYLPVFDLVTDEPIGKLVNVSNEGAMLITSNRIKANTLFQCRVKLPSQILDREEIVFDAECRWCRKNIAEGRWESGYRLNATGINVELISYLVLSLKLGKWGENNINDVKTVDIKNRRKEDRYEFDKPLPVYEHKRYRQIGELADISTQGARLITRKPIPKDNQFYFRVLLPETIFQQEYLVFEARCMWCRQLKGTNDYESGYKIVNISEKDAVIILHLLIYHSEAQQTRKVTRVIQ